LFFGSGDSSLYCVHANDGALVWKFKTGGAVHSSPAVVDGEVFFGSHDGNFYALNANDGKAKWTFKTEGEKLFSAKGIHGQLPKDSLFVDEWDFWLSSPAIEGNNIYFGSGDGYFYALNKIDGTEKWKFKTTGIIHSSPALAFGNVYFGGWDTYLHALNAQNGKEVWKFKTPEDTVIYNQTGITSSPVIIDSIVYFGCRDSRVYALDAVTGKLQWSKYNQMGWISQTPSVFDNKVMYASGSSKRFVALDKNTGDSVYNMNAETGAFSSPSIVGTTLFYGDFAGVMHARDVATGKLIWSFHVPSTDPYRILNPDFSFNDSLIDVAVKKYKGSKSFVQIILTKGAILSSPVVKDGTIYFGSTDGYLYALQ
ncbi:MAG: PQQ-binding-like beta-propeller repeat protein, partial [Saprospiraceae bacterium]